MAEKSSEGLQSELEKLCECVICCERVTNPRTLPCDHSFCKECLDELVMFKPKNPIPYVVCPNRCGEQCLSPGSTIHKMKASLYLRQLLDLVDKTMPVEVLSQSTDAPLCGTSECNRPLRIYCISCQKFYCHHCFKNNVAPCKDKHEVKMVCYSKRRNTIEPYCTKHECSAIYQCQTCSANYLCKYCKHYSHADHRVAEITFQHAFKPFKTQKVTLNRYNDLFEDLNTVVSCVWKNLEVTEANFARFLERRKMELTLQFFDQMLAAEASIKKQYETKVQNFIGNIFDRKQKFEDLIARNKQYRQMLDDLDNRTVAELLFDTRLNEIEDVVKENQSVYKAMSHMDEFKIYVTPNKELVLDKPFGHVNFSKDILKDEEVIKKLQVLNPVTDSKREKVENLREKNLNTIKDKLNQLFAVDFPSTISSPNPSNRNKQKTASSDSFEPIKPSTPITQRSLSSSDISPVATSATGNKSLPPDVPKRSPIRIPEHPPTPVQPSSRKSSLAERHHATEILTIAEEVSEHNNSHGNHSENHEENEVIATDNTSWTCVIQKNNNTKATTSNIEENDEAFHQPPRFYGQHDSLPLRKNQLKQKRRPPSSSTVSQSQLLSNQGSQSSEHPTAGASNSPSLENNRT